jgi:hypothetical protein
MPGGSRDQSTGELCDGRDNDCDGTTDDGSIQQLCGTVPNASLRCSGSACSISSRVSSAYADMDDAWQTGCECALSGQSVIRTGKIAPAGDVDWYRVHATHFNAVGPGDAYHLQVTFAPDGNPGGQFVIDVYDDNCTTLPQATCESGGNGTGRTQYDRAVDFFTGSGTLKSFPTNSAWRLHPAPRASRRVDSLRRIP